jgi:hypothetical protein
VRLLRAFSVLAVLCGVTIAAFSQAPAPTTVPAQAAAPAGGTATLSGIVSDKTGAVVQKAAVTLTEAGGAKKEAVSDDKGTYAFPGLAAGTYTLSVTAPNFSVYTAPDINLTAGADIPLDVTLEPKSENTQVEVSSAPPKIETTASNIEGTINATEVVKAPLNGRNFSQLIALAPGVSNQTGQDEAKVGVVGSVKYSVNGGRVEYNTFEVDGADVLNTGINGAASTLIVYPSLDAINEVKVLTSNYGAQYGRTASGTVIVSTKSGENFGGKYHGVAYEFLRNEFFNSRNYFDQGAHAPLYRRHDFGGTFGGPLSIPGFYNTKKDKTFFFFSEEFRLEKTPTDFNQAVPSLTERAGDFSDVCPPTTSQPGIPNNNPLDRKHFPDCPITGGSQSPYSPGNTLLQPPNGGGTAPFGIDHNAALLLASNLIPLPNSNIGCNSTIGSCYNTTVSPSTYWREELIRVDHHFTTKAQITARYIHDSWDTTVLTPQWGIVRNSFPTVQNRFVGPGTSLIVHLTNIVTPTLINEFVVSYGNSNISLTNRNGPGGAQYQRNPLLDQPLVPDPSNPNPSVCNPQISHDPFSLIPQCQIGYLFNNGFGGKMPGIVIGGTNGAYGGRGIAVDPSYTPWTHTNPIYSLRDDLLKSFGHHTVTLGAQFILSQRNQDSNAIGGATGDLQGLLTYSNVTGGNGDTGNAFANFLIGYPNPTALSTGAALTPIQSFTQDSSQGRYHQRYQIAEPYVQDDWQITKRLTLNIGLRMSFFGNFEERNQRAYNFVPAAFSQSLAAQLTIDPSTGILLDTKTRKPIPFSPNQFGPQDLDPRMTNGIVQCGVKGVSPGCMNSHLINPAPRIGFAWDPFGDHRTSIRGGYGIFFEHGTGNEANTGSLEASSPLVLSMTQRFPQGYPCIGSIGGGSTPNCVGLGSANLAIGAYPLNITAIPTRTVWPYAQQWSFSVQRELPRDFVASFAYVGSKGTNLTLQRQINQLTPVPDVNNPFAPGEPITPTIAVVGGGGDCALKGTGFLLQNGTLVTPSNPAFRNLLAACAGAGGQIPDTNSLRPYPGYGQIFSLENIANSSYHAFQATMRHTKGAITMGASYSYSHAIDNSSDRSDTVFVNTLDPKSNRASSNFDQRHLLNANYIYQLPIMKWANAMRGWNNEASSDNETPGYTSELAKKLLDGWEISGITTFQSGTPFSVVNGGGNTGIAVADNAGIANGVGPASYPDVIPGQAKPAGGSNAQSFGPLLGNPSQFVAPRGLTFGNAGRNFLNNPSRLNFDMTLLKHFKVREGTQLEFRAEAFNIFNHTQFRIYDADNPGSSGNNIISCYGGPSNSAGFQAAGGTDCLTGASFLHPINAHRPRTLQLGLKLSF